MGVQRAGLVGCGNISQAYFTALKQLHDVDLVACADIRMEAAEAKAKENGVEAREVDALFDSDDIDIILNLTLPQTHASVNMRALNAGKHAYCEKPFAVTRDEAQAVLQTAEKTGLRVGCAPDTFLGAGQQTARRAIDEGLIGKPVSGTAFMAVPGHERWHPNPGFYYLNGGGPLFDMGPYYITTLINMLGPIKEVAAVNSRRADERVATSEGANGQVLPVEIDTHISSILVFESGAVITMVMSFDVFKHTNHNIEIHGTTGSLSVPDPNNFDGEIRLSVDGGDWTDVEVQHIYGGNMRGLGLADMARAVATDRAHRCAGELANHVLDVMHAIVEASAAKTHVQVQSTCTRPAPLPTGLADGRLD